MVSRWPSEPRVPERVDGGRTRLGEWLARVRTGGRCCGLVRVSVAPYSKVSRADPKPFTVCTDEITWSRVVIQLWQNRSRSVDREKPFSKRHISAGTLGSGSITCDKYAHPYRPRVPSLTHSLLFVVSGSERCSARIETRLVVPFIIITIVSVTLSY